jgi:hypothetical protein
MLRFIVGVFVVLHGLVHLLYFGHGQRLFELAPGLVWPDGAWAFSWLLGQGGTRLLAGISCVLAAIGFVAGGAGILAKQAWWRPAVVAAAAFSAAIYILCWDGGLQRLPEKGAFAILINATILVAVLVFRWPAFDF